MEKLWDIPFFLAKSSKQHLSLLGVRSIFLESIGAVVMKNLLSLKKILKIIKVPEFFAKGYEKCEILSEILEKKITNLGDYACPKIQILNFKYKEYD